MATEEIDLMLQFAELHGRMVLLAEEDEVRQIAARLESELKSLEDRIEADPDGAEARSLISVRDHAKADFETYVERRHDLLRHAVTVTFRLRTYSWYEQMLAQEHATTIDPDSGAVRVSQDRMRAELFEICVLAKNNHPLSREEKRELAPNVANRLWRHIRNASEPSEADFFTSTTSWLI